MKIFAVMLKDLRLISRDRFALVSLLIVPMVVILVVASATQSGDGSESILFPIVNEDQGPVASALIKVFRKHLDVREVTRSTAERLVADRLPCFATAQPAPAAISAAVVETLNVLRPPPVPDVSSRSSRSLGT